MELNRIEQARIKLEKSGRHIMNLSSGNPGEFGIVFPEKILAEGFKNFQKNPVYHPDPKGDASAREAVKNFYAARGFEIPARNILLTSGTSESYLHLFKLLGRSPEGRDTGGEILFPNPGYPLFDHIADIAGIRLNHYLLDVSNNWQIDFKDLEAKISPKTKAIVLISPDNPTGGVLTEATLLNLLSLAKKHGIAVISDEVFCDFMFDGKVFPRIAALNKNALDVNIFTLNGISKTYALPGLKLGWIVATGPNAEDDLDELELSVDTLLAGNQVSQAMLPTIVEKGGDFIADYRRRLEKSRNAAVEMLGVIKNITFNKPAGGFYLFAQIHNYRGSDEDFVIELMERTGIFVHPGYFYDYEKGLHVLISFLMKADLLRQTLERFNEAVNVLTKQ